MRRLACSTLLAFVVAGGCTDHGWPPLTIVNRTGRPIEVNLVGQTDSYEELPLIIPASGGIGIVAGPFRADSDGCISGSLVALQDGREIARKDQPCGGGEWDIIAPAVPSP